MGRGKIAVQVAHAAVTAAEIARKHEPSWWQRWLDEGQKKVVVKVSTLKDLLAIYDEAVRSKLPSDIIRDRGLTEIPPGSVTTVGIGPAPTKKVDKITANLPLL